MKWMVLLLMIYFSMSLFGQDLEQNEMSENELILQRWKEHAERAPKKETLTVQIENSSKKTVILNISDNQDLIELHSGKTYETPDIIDNPIIWFISESDEELGLKIDDVDHWYNLNHRSSIIIFDDKLQYFDEMWDIVVKHIFDYWEIPIWSENYEHNPRYRNLEEDL